MITFDPCVHTYTKEDGTVLISVTQLLKKHSIAPDFSGVNKDVLEHKAELGTNKHSYIEKFIKSNGADFEPDEDLMYFSDNIYPLYTDWVAETLIYTEELPVDYAGQIDLIAKNGNRFVLIDTKTGQVHRESVSWQLSLYRKAWCKLNNIDEDVVDLFCFDAKGSDSRLIPIAPISDKEINHLLECERDGIPYTTSEVVISENLIQEARSFTELVTRLDEQKKQAELQFTKAKEEILNAMSKFGIFSLDMGSLHITRVASSIRKTLDKDLVVKTYPEVESDSKFWKTTNVKESLRMTIKEDK